MPTVGKWHIRDPSIGSDRQFGEKEGCASEQSRFHGCGWSSWDCAWAVRFSLCARDPSKPPPILACNAGPEPLDHAAPTQGVFRNMRWTKSSSILIEVRNFRRQLTGHPGAYWTINAHNVDLSMAAGCRNETASWSLNTWNSGLTLDSIAAVFWFQGFDLVPTRRLLRIPFPLRLYNVYSCSHSRSKRAILYRSKKHNSLSKTY